MVDQVGALVAPESKSSMDLEDYGVHERQIAILGSRGFHVRQHRKGQNTHPPAANDPGFGSAFWGPSPEGCERTAAAPDRRHASAMPRARH